MTSADIVLRWLTDASSRIRSQRRIREGAWAVACLLAIAACDAMIVRFAGEPAVIVALRVLLLLAAIAVLIGCGVRMWWRPDLAAVAATADAKAGLGDALLSAQWFASHREATPFVAAHLERVSAMTRDLGIARLFPLAVPRSALIVAIVAASVAGAAWSLSRTALVADIGTVPGEAARGASAPTVSLPGNASDEAATEAGGRSQAAVLWKQLETLAAGLSQRPEGRSLAEAIAARDVRAAAQIARAAKADASAGTDAAGAASSPGEQMNDVLAQAILERLGALLKAEQSAPAAPTATDGEADRPTARLDRELRADQDDAQRGAPRQQSAGEDALNTSLRALSRSSTGGRDAVHGEADSTEGAGRANVGGGAMGRRVGMSTAGAGDGDQPVGNIVAPEQGDTVLGRRTERLAVQWHAVKVQQGDAGERDDEPTGTEESMYAATRAQAARVGFRAVDSVARSDAESASGSEASPLEYREAVKRYTLTRHRREPDPNRASAASR